jgi:hypothetical protein
VRAVERAWVVGFEEKGAVPMNDLPHQERRAIVRTAKDDDQGGITRRTVLTGAAAATAVATLPVVDRPPASAAPSPDPNPQDMVAFILLSSALTGIAETRLAPGFGPLPKPPTPIDFDKLLPGADPVDVKSEYFKWVNKRHPATFEKLRRIAKDNLNAPPNRELAIIGKIPTGDDTELTQSEIDLKYLARSIVLMWYLGAWYDPDNLQTPNASNFEVISPKAYTQGWALKVAQAHPMGFSEMQFGYWTRPPNPRGDFIG